MFERLKKVFGNRFSIGQLIGVAISLLILGMVLSVGAMFTTQMKNTGVVANDTTATSILDKVLEAFSTFADWINPLAFISVASVVILILVAIYVKLRGAVAVATE